MLHEWLDLSCALSAAVVMMKMGRKQKPPLTTLAACWHPSPIQLYLAYRVDLETEKLLSITLHLLDALCCAPIPEIVVAVISPTLS